MLFSVYLSILTSRARVGSGNLLAPLSTDSAILIFQIIRQIFRSLSFPTNNYFSMFCTFRDRHLSSDPCHASYPSFALSIIMCLHISSPIKIVLCIMAFIHDALILFGQNFARSPKDNPCKAGTGHW